MIPNTSNEIKVGLFVGMGILLFMVTTMMIGGGQSLIGSSVKYKTKMESVTGLVSGSVVQILGIPAGNVLQVQLMEDSKNIEVIFKINKKYKNRITEGTTTGIKTQGALGDKFVYITPGPIDAPVLPENSWLQTRVGSNLFSMISDGNRFDRVFHTIDEIYNLLYNLNANGKSAELMPNLVESTALLKESLTELNALLKDIKGNTTNRLNKSLLHLSNVLGKLDNGTGTLGSLINDSEIHERIKAFLGGQSRSKKLNSLVRDTIEINDK